MPTLEILHGTEIYVDGKKIHVHVHVFPILAKTF